MLDIREQRGIRARPNINYGMPYGPGSVVNQLYQISLQLSEAIRKKYREEKWMLWIAFQKYHTRALNEAKNIDEELPIPGPESFPDWYFENPIFDDISDDMMIEVIQPVIDRLEKRLFAKGLSIHG